MILKSIEIRDRMTFIAAIAIKMVPSGGPGIFGSVEQLYLLRRCGYAFDYPAVILLRMDGDGRAAPADPYHWRDRTFQTAHIYITEHFDELADGAVVDVEYILGETAAPKKSERLSNVL